MLTGEMLSRIAPKCPEPGKWAEEIRRAVEKFGIKNMAAFIAQGCHESWEFSKLEENLNYSAEGLMRTWPKKFSKEFAAALAHNPESIANYVYANRMGNGDVASGDGFRYRGRGLVQLTGRENYGKCGGALGVDLIKTPTLLVTPIYACQSFAWYLADNKLNYEFVNRNIFFRLSQRINGTAGTPNGWESRLKYWERAKELGL